jgi:hypothetical protein
MIPTAQSGHTFSFQTQHENNIGLYPAALLATSVFITTNLVYGFQDVTTNVIAMIVTATTVTIGYRDVDTDELIRIENVPLTERLLVTEDTSTITEPKLLINRQLTRRQTVAPNNLPFNITSQHVVASAAPAGIYFPPDGTSYSYLNIRIKNPFDEELRISINFGAVSPRQLFYTIDKNTVLQVKNVIVAYNETVSVTALTVDPVSVYIGAMHMEGRL